MEVLFLQDCKGHTQGNNMEFEKSFPSITYEPEDGKIEAYTPAIPIPQEERLIGIDDIQFVGAYPDFVTIDVASHRDRLEAENKGLLERVHALEGKVQFLEIKNCATTASLKEAKVMLQNEVRGRNLWQEKFSRLVAAQGASVANNNVTPGIAGLDNNGFLISNGFGEDIF